MVTPSGNERDAVADSIVNHLLHDIKGGLATFRIGIDALRDTSRELDESKRIELLDIVTSHCDALLLMINGYRDLGEMQNGRLKRDSELVALEKCVGRLGAALEQAAEKRGSTYHPSISGASGNVEFRAALIDPIIDRLILAISACLSNNTEIKLKVKASKSMLQVEIAFHCPDARVELLESVFSREGQAKHGLRIGRGYALLFCREAARYMGGELKLLPWPGRGYRIVMNLPFERVNFANEQGKP